MSIEYVKNPTGMCLCGCGKLAPLATTSRRGYKRGESLMYIKGHSSRKVHEFEIDENGCWIWVKFRDRRHGYGRAWDGERVRSAHAVMYERQNGPVPDGYELHHECGVRACVNPAHLALLTRREHMAAEGRRPFGNPKAPVPA